MALVIEHGTYPLLRLMIKIFSYDTMKLEADKSLKIFHVPSALMGFFHLLSFESFVWYSILFILFYSIQ